MLTARLISIRSTPEQLFLQSRKDGTMKALSRCVGAILLCASCFLRPATAVTMSTLELQGFNGVRITNVLLTGDGSLNDTVSYAAGVAQASIDTQRQLLTASSSVTAGPTVRSNEATTLATAYLTYTISVEQLPGSTAPTRDVPISLVVAPPVVTASGTLGASEFSQLQAEGFASLVVKGGVGGNELLVNMDTFVGWNGTRYFDNHSTFSQRSSVGANVGDILTVFLNAGTSNYGSYGATMSAFAQVDPLFSITGPFASQYVLRFSDNIGNGEPVVTPPPVPEPSTVLLLAGGLAWMLVWRRRSERHHAEQCHVSED